MLTTRRTFAASVNEDDGAAVRLDKVEEEADGGGLAGADIETRHKDPGQK